MNSRFDAIIVGAGQAGRPLAGRLSEVGLTAALVERKLIGGTCTNTGCTPTKALVASAQVAHLARRAADYGIGTGPVTIDMKAVKARKDAVVTRSRESSEAWLALLARCSVIHGQARFVSPTEVRVGDRILSAERIFLDVGARPRVPNLPGLDRVRTLTSTTILDLEAVPRHLVVIGGGYIGLEFAQMHRRFGAEVTVVEMGPRLVGREDEDVSAAVKGILEAEGITVRLGAECLSFSPAGSDIRVHLGCDTGAPEVVASHVLLAVGREPNTRDLGLPAAGVECDRDGYIKVTDDLRTTAANVWALGNCNRRGAFTHTAWNDFEIVAANLFDGGHRKVSDRIPALALYIDPPLGRVGLTEAEARAKGLTIRIGKRLMTRVGRAVERGETQGFMKVVVDGTSDRILGAAILGVGGDEAIHGLIVAINAGMTATDYALAVPVHPTVAELIPTVLGELKP